MRRWWTLGLFVVAAMAGCLEGEADDGADDENMDDHDDSMDDMNGTMNMTNTAPVAALSPDGGANATLETVNGTSVLTATVPFNVTFDIVLDDQDGDDLDWTLDVDGDGAADSEGTAVADNGTYAAVNFTFSYTEAGNYSVTLNVTDGTDFASVLLQVRALDAVGDTADVEFPDDPTCKTDPDAVSDPTGTFYMTAETWVYQESNDRPGLQRDDDDWPDTCEIADTFIF